MSSRTFGGVVIECLQGDITAQGDIDVIVNAANAQLRTGGGVAGAIHAAAGPGLEEEARALAPILPGEAVMTGAHRLPNHRIIHCLGPVYGRDEPAAALLASCYRDALLLADEHGMRSIAFPSISTGAFGYPLEEAARVAVRALVDEIPRLGSITNIRLVLFGRRALEVYEQALSEAVG